MVLMQSSMEGGMKAARGRKKEWWDANFAMVKSWSPNMVAKKRRVWVICRGCPPSCMGGEMFQNDGRSSR